MNWGERIVASGRDQDRVLGFGHTHWADVAVKEALTSKKNNIKKEQWLLITKLPAMRITKLDRNSHFYSDFFLLFERFYGRASNSYM